MKGEGPNNKIFGPDEGDFNVDDLFAEDSGLMFDAVTRGTPGNGVNVIDTEPIDAAELQARMETASHYNAPKDIPTEVMSAAEVAAAISESEIAAFKAALGIPEHSETKAEEAAASKTIVAAPILKPTLANADPDDDDAVLRSFTDLYAPTDEEIEAAEKAEALAAKQKETAELEAAEQLTVEQQLSAAEAKRKAKNPLVLEGYYPKTGVTLLTAKDTAPIEHLLAGELEDVFGELAIGLSETTNGGHSEEGVLPDEVAEAEEAKEASFEAAKTDISIQKPAASLQEAADKKTDSAPKLPTAPSKTVASYQRRQTDTSFPAIGYSLGKGTPVPGLKAVKKHTKAAEGFQDPWAELSPSEAFKASASVPEPVQKMEAVESNEDQSEKAQKLALLDFQILFKLSDSRINDLRSVRNDLDRLVKNAKNAGVDDSKIIEHLLKFSKEEFNNKHVQRAVQDKLREFGVIVKAPGFWERNWKKAAAAVAIAGTAVGLTTWKLSKEDETENGAVIASNNDINDDLNIKKATNGADNSLTKSALAGAMAVAPEAEANGDADFWADLSSEYGSLEDGAEELMLNAIANADAYAKATKLAASNVEPGIGNIKTQKIPYLIERGDSYWKIAAKEFPKNMEEDKNGWLPVLAIYMANYRDAATGEYLRSLDKSIRHGRELLIPTQDEVSRLIASPEFRSEANTVVDDYLKEKLADNEITASQYLAQLSEFKDLLNTLKANAEMAAIAADLEEDSFDGDEVVAEVEFQLNNNVDKYWGYSAAGLTKGLLDELADEYKQEDADRFAMPINVMPVEVSSETQAAVADALAAVEESLDADIEAKWSNTASVLAELDAEEAAENEWGNMLANWGTNEEQA